MNGQLTKGGRTMPVSNVLRSSIIRGTLAVSLALPLLGMGTLRAAAVADVPAGVQAAAVPSVVRTPVATLPANSACVAGATDTTCEIWAKAGTSAITASKTVPVWSFAPAAGDSVTVPVGPVLQVNEGQTVHLTLHNQLTTGFSPDVLSLSMPQVDGFPEDDAGVAPGGSKTYDFVAKRPGTFLYQAGGTAGGARAAAMGLIGALVVVPGNDSATAYGTTASHFDDQSVVVVSDVDPGLNSDPIGFDMRNFAPHFRLYNGTAFPATASIPVTAGGTTLLRFVNGGVIQHAIGVLGAPATVFATAARPVPIPYGVAAENIAAGDTLDLLVNVPVGDGLRYAVYDPTMRLDNDGGASSLSTGNIVAFGGGLTFLQSDGVAPPPNNAPVVSAVTITPPTVVGSAATSIAFNASVTDDSSVQSVEYAIDNATGPWTAVPITAGPTVTLTNVNVPIAPATLLNGAHQLFVRGSDATGPGSPVPATFKVDLTAPSVTALATATAITTGAAPLAFSGTAVDVGGGNVTTVTWALDGVGTFPATLAPPTGPTVAISGSVPTASLTEGPHTLTATATDSLGNVGAAGPGSGVSFLVDATAPTTGPVTITPSPNDGSQGVAYDPTSVEVRSPYSDAGSGVGSGELFIGNAGTPGTGALMTANVATNSLVGLIPLSQLNGLAGNVTISVRAKDKAGNWSAPAQGTLIINRTITVSGLTVTPTTTATAATAALAGTAAASAGQTVGGAEYYIDTPVPAGSGTAMTVGPLGQSAPITANVPIGGLTVGTHTIGVRARTSLGAWGPVSTVQLTLTHLFSDSFAGGIVPPWLSQSTSNGGGLAVVGNALQVTASGTNSRAFVTTPTINPVVSGYHTTFALTPNTLFTQNRWVSVFRAVSGNGNNPTERFRVEYRRNSTGPAQVRLVVSTGNNGTSTVPATGQVALNSNASTSNTITVDWSSPSLTGVSLTVNGVTTTRSGLNTSNRTVTNGRLGVSSDAGSAPTGSSGAYGGTVILDAFDSARYAF